MAPRRAWLRVTLGRRRSPARRKQVEPAGKCTEVYDRACARYGRPHSKQVLQDLREHGALVVDLLLHDDVDPLWVFLREAPRGIRQLVFYDGSVFFGHDHSYRVKWRASRLRDSYCILRDEDRLREMVCAVQVFCSVRGASLTVLELTGVPLGTQALPPLVRCLRDLPALQRLHLERVGLQDYGLALLLPQLASSVGGASSVGSGGTLPKLSHLSLADNGLRDVRLISHLLKGRMEAQRRGKAVPLCILDLSLNPFAGAASRTPPGAEELPRRCFAKDATRRRPQAPAPQNSRYQLLTTVCEALQAGLKLRTLRLRSVGLSKDDLRPLLQMLYREVALRQSGFHGDFVLAEVSLEDNPLEPEFQGAINRALRRLEEQPPVAADGFPGQFGGVAGASGAMAAPGDIGGGPCRQATDRLLRPSSSAPVLTQGLYRDRRVPTFREVHERLSVGVSAWLPSEVEAVLPIHARKLQQLDGRICVRQPDRSDAFFELMPDLDRNAVSECDADAAQDDLDALLVEPDGRDRLRQQFGEDCQMFATRLGSPAPPVPAADTQAFSFAAPARGQGSGREPRADGFVVPTAQQTRQTSLEQGSLGAARPDAASGTIREPRRSGMQRGQRPQDAHRPPTDRASSSSVRSDALGVYSVGEIPDRGDQFGFAPPSHGGPSLAAHFGMDPAELRAAQSILVSDSEESGADAGWQRSGCGQQQPPPQPRPQQRHQPPQQQYAQPSRQAPASGSTSPPGGRASHEGSQRLELNGRGSLRTGSVGNVHARLEPLTRLFSSGRGMPANEEVLEYVLNAVDSDTSLNPEDYEEALARILGDPNARGADAEQLGYPIGGGSVDGEAYAVGLEYGFANSSGRVGVPHGP